jgi:hypothetical protein
MTTPDLRFRQVHLDFHTSEAIAGIGSRFDPEAFAARLEAAHVNSITCFARGHHGMIYYDTEISPERRHPHLTRNLLKEQIEACHARGIRVPIYTTIQWDHYTATHHPDWVAVTADGGISGTPPYEAGFYRNLCVNSPYFDFLKAHVTEILEMLPVDGFFFDIVHPLDDSSKWTRQGMEAAGLDPADPAARIAYGNQVIDDFKRELSALVRQHAPDATIFYNSGHVGPSLKPTAETYSHWELESLPSGGWGYMHFPLSVRYARTLGHDCLGMTGKFHTTWGDFHAYKNQAALEFECFNMLAMGAKCSIGDQLLPDGRLDEPTYDLIGAVYSQVEAKEPWCVAAEPLVEIGLFHPEAFSDEINAGVGRVPPAASGASRMLQEAAYQFDLIDPDADLSRYKLLILPDIIPVSESLAAKLAAYLAAGGALIASFESGLNAAQDDFALKSLGVRLTGENVRDLQGRVVRGRNYPKHDYTEYLRPGEAIGRGLPLVEHAMYLKGVAVAAEAGTEVLADRVASYFDRTYRHFCSHNQTPSSGEVAGPAVVRNGQSIYFSQPIFTQYAQNAPRWCKTLVLNAISLLLPQPLVQQHGPSTLLTALNAQPTLNRQVLHLLHYIPERRGTDFDTIEDVIPLYNVAVSVQAAQPVQSVVAVPQGQPLDFEIREGYVHFTVPEINGHQLIEIQ